MLFLQDIWVQNPLKILNKILQIKCNKISDKDDTKNVLENALKKLFWGLLIADVYRISENWAWLLEI